MARVVPELGSDMLGRVQFGAVVHNWLSMSGCGGGAGIVDCHTGSDQKVALYPSTSTTKRGVFLVEKFCKSYGVRSALVILILLIGFIHNDYNENYMIIQTVVIVAYSSLNIYWHGGISKPMQMLEMILVQIHHLTCSYQ